MIRLPPAPRTNEIPPVIRGEVPHTPVKLPHAFAHSGEIGLFGDDATVPLVKPSGRELHPPMPVTSPIKPIPFPMPSIPKDLKKGITPPATKCAFGMARIEQHGKKNVPVVFRG